VDIWNDITTVCINHYLSNDKKGESASHKTKRTYGDTFYSPKDQWIDSRQKVNLERGKMTF